MCLVRNSEAQDDFFKPVIEAAPTKTPVGGAQVYSFGRFEPDFRAVCAELEREGQRVPIVILAEQGVEREKECITCRSFWKMIVSACSRLGPKPTPTAKPTKVPKGTTEGTEASSEVAEKSEEAESAESGDETVEAPVATPTATSVPKQGERVPSVELVDLLSRLSAKAFDFDPGTGATAHMFQEFAKGVRTMPGLNPSEREYYDVFCAYLLAAWEGRVDRTKLPTPTPQARVLQQIFDFD